uniref:Anoctamin n=1 Tax=Romanomermis culicivorax TaxID=13658 RepID=A0A915IIG1_ROMCU
MLSIPSVLGLIVFVESLWSMRNDDELRNVCDKNATPGNFWMCPICHPPYCEAWEMYREGCRKYKWEFSLDNEGTLTLSCLVTLWAIFFLKFWKRRESTMSGQFNTLRFRSRHSGMRPDYEIRSTTVQKNPVTGEVEPHVPLRLRVFWHSVSILCTISILAMAGLCLVGLVVSRIALYAVFHKMGGHLAKHNIEASRWFTHGLIFLLIAVFEGIYKFLVGKLTKYECPRTPHEFMNNMLWKLFVFELLIDFVPICYAAWLKGRTVQTPLNLNWLTELCDAGCTSEVVELVFVLLFLRLIVGNFLEIAVPFFRHCFRKFQHTRRTSHRNLPQWLKDYYLNEVELDGVFEDYMEMMVQFAFVVLFPPVFPLAALICLSRCDKDAEDEQEAIAFEASTILKLDTFS